MRNVCGWLITRHLFSINVTQAPIGLFGFLPTVFVLLLLRENVDSAFSYTAVVGLGNGAFISLFFTTCVAMFWAGCTGAFFVLYVNGIVSEGTGKYDKRPGETDGVGSLLDDMRGAGTQCHVYDGAGRPRPGRRQRMARVNVDLWALFTLQEVRSAGAPAWQTAASG